MNLKDAILNRRSIRVYNDKMVSREDLIEILNDAVYAPTHQTRQSWRFVLIDGEALQNLVNKLDTIFAGVDPDEARIDYRKKVFGGARAVLVFINEKSDTDPIWTMEEIGASVSLIQNFQLLAFEKGIGSCYKSRLIQSKLLDYLGVKENEMVTGALTLGYYDTLPNAKERIKAEEKLTIL